MYSGVGNEKPVFLVMFGMQSMMYRENGSFLIVISLA